MSNLTTGFVGSIDNATLQSTYFRQVLFTGPHMQLVVMCVGLGEDIGREKHADVDQFIRIERGEDRGRAVADCAGKQQALGALRIPVLGRSS